MGNKTIFSNFWEKKKSERKNSGNDIQVELEGSILDEYMSITFSGEQSSIPALVRNEINLMGCSEELCMTH